MKTIKKGSVMFRMENGIAVQRVKVLDSTKKLAKIADYSWFKHPKDASDEEIEQHSEWIPIVYLEHA